MLFSGTKYRDSAGPINITKSGDAKNYLQAGLDQLDASYNVGENIENPDGIMVRFLGMGTSGYLVDNLPYQHIERHHHPRLVPAHQKEDIRQYE